MTQRWVKIELLLLGTETRHLHTGWMMEQKSHYSGCIFLLGSSHLSISYSTFLSKECKTTEKSEILAFCVFVTTFKE